MVDNRLVFCEWDAVFAGAALQELLVCAHMISGQIGRVGMRHSRLYRLLFAVQAAWAIPKSFSILLFSAKICTAPGQGTGAAVPGPSPSRAYQRNLDIVIRNDDTELADKEVPDFNHYLSQFKQFIE